VFDIGVEDGVDFLAMELVAGELLSARITSDPVCENDAILLSIQLLDGLASAHRNGVVHRDLKPSNLMVTPDGRLKMLDFGVALRIPNKDVSATSTYVEPATILEGTVACMAPEQLRGAAGNELTDVYSAGAVVHELVTGKRPFPQSRSNELIAAILHESIPAPHVLRPEISRELDGIIMKALERDASKRFQSADQFRLSLEALHSRPRRGRAVRHLTAGARVHGDRCGAGWCRLVPRHGTRS
jgi:serine/threonine protein kinase